MKTTYKGENYIVIDEIKYKGHTIQTLHKFGGYTFYTVDNEKDFGTMKDAKEYIRKLTA